jgi:cobalamin biosynthesis Mg chelatase CobN
MTILCICTSSLNDTIPLNIIYHSFLTTTSKDALNIDLITTDNAISSNIFLGDSILRNQIKISLTKSFYDSFKKMNDYDVVIKIASSFKSELIFSLLKTKNKIRTPFKFLTLFKKTAKSYQKELSDKKSRHFLDQLHPNGIAKNLEPIININKTIYAKTFEIVNWVLKSANKQSLTNNNFCFIYFNELHQFDAKEKWVEQILDALLENNVQVIPVFNYNLEEFSHKKSTLLIDDFVYNSDANHIYLFLKYSKFVITNDESLKIACGLTKKPHLYYNFDDKELILQDVIKDINFLIN